MSADTYEAIIAAIYLDGGFAEAKKFVERQVLTALEGQFVVIADENYKSMLLEYSQSRALDFLSVFNAFHRQRKPL